MAEDYSNSFRFLRADHSLLGGRWIGEKVYTKEPTAKPLTDAEGTKLGDSIYSAFVLQEAVRLHERPGKQENALIM